MPVRIVLALIASLGALSLSAHTQTIFHSTVDEAQETPPSGSSAVGTGFIVFHPSTSVMDYTIDVVGSYLGAYTVSHVHIGAVGVPGPTIFPLMGGPTMFAGSSPALMPGEVTLLRTSGLYFNIHTTAFPSGEIRGQIHPSLYKLVAVMNASKEVPPNGSAATGTAEVVLDPTTKTLTYSASVTGMTATAAHIHEGAPGVPGPVIFPLTSTGPNAWGGMTVPLTDLQIAKFRSELYYVNVHSSAFPDGEIRGQLVPSFTPYGSGCPGSGGLTPVLDGSGVPTPGGTVMVSISNGLPSGTGFLWASFNGVDQPFIKNCPLYVQLPLLLQLKVTLNGSGSLAFPVTIPPIVPPGTWFQAQFFGVDSGAPNNLFSSSNGIGMHVSN